MVANNLAVLKFLRLKTFLQSEALAVGKNFAVENNLAAGGIHALGNIPEVKLLATKQAGAC